EVAVARIRAHADDEPLAVAGPPAPLTGDGPEAKLAVVQQVARLLGIAVVRLRAVTGLEGLVAQPQRLLIHLDRAAAERAVRVLKFIAHAGRRRVGVAVGDAAHR